MYTEQILSPKGELYQFTIGKSGVYYLGGWHFEKTDFHFADEWAAKKESIAKEYLNVNFDAAITAVPHE